MKQLTTERLPPLPLPLRISVKPAPQIIGWPFSVQINAFRRSSRNAKAYCDRLHPHRLTVAARGGRKCCSQIPQVRPKQQCQAVLPVAGLSWPCKRAHSIQSKRPQCVRWLLNMVLVEMRIIASQPLFHSINVTYNFFKWYALHHHIINLTFIVAEFSRFPHCPCRRKDP